MKLHSQETSAAMQLAGTQLVIQHIPANYIECSCYDLSHEVILLMCGRALPALLPWQTCTSS